MLAIGIALRAVLPGAVHTIAMPAADIATARPAARRARRRRCRSSSRSGRGRRAVHATTRDLDRCARCSAAWRPSCCRTSAPTRNCWFPLVARALGGTDATAAMSRTHAEIEHQVGRLRRLLADLDERHRPTRGRRSSCAGCSTASTPSCACTTPRRRRARSASSPTEPRATPRNCIRPRQTAATTVFHRQVFFWRRSPCGQH